MLTCLPNYTIIFICSILNVNLQIIVKLIINIRSQIEIPFAIYDIIVFEKKTIIETTTK